MGIYLNSKDQILMKNSVGYRIMSLMSVVYLLFFPLASTVLPVISGAIVVLIVLSAIALYLFSGKEKWQFNQDERLFYFSVTFMVTVVVLVTALSGIDYLGAKKLGKFVYLLMIIPVYYYFKTIQIKPAWIWYGLVGGAIASALVGVYEVANEVYIPRYANSARARGATHPIIFGDLALIIGVMALSGFGWFRKKKSFLVILPVMAVCSGVLASLLSQSRGGWVAIPFMAAILIWYSMAYISKIKIFMGVFAMVGILIVTYLIPQTGLKNRTNMTIENIQKYADADVTSRTGGTSVTSRFEMWRASWDIFLENPLLGVGWGNYQKNAKELVKNGERNRSAGNWSHPHNQFVSAMVNGGIFALIAIILLFFIPMKIFYNTCKSPERSLDARRMALAGLLLMVGFAVFNLSESFLERSRTTSFFIFYLALFMAGIRESNVTVVGSGNSKN